MHQLDDFSDGRQKSWCIYCGCWIDTNPTSADHVPSKCLLEKPYPQNLPTISVCRGCNNDLSRDEEYFAAILGCVLAGSTEPKDQIVGAAARALARSPGLRARIEQSRVQTRTDDGREIWYPDYERISRVVLKNARGHAFFELGEPMLDEPQSVIYAPLQTLSTENRLVFEGAGGGMAIWPEVGSRLMQRLITGQDMQDGWIVVQPQIYRYSVVQDGGVVVKSVLFEYLATEVVWAEPD